MKLKSLEDEYGIGWQNFKIEEFLDWQKNISEISPLKLDEYSISDKKKYPFYGQAKINNGIIEYCELREEFLNNVNSKPTILIHSNNQNVVYLDTPFYLKDGHGATSVLQSKFLNRNIALYIMTVIEKVIVSKFSYNNKATKIALKNTNIKLPVVSDGELAFKYMDQVIDVLESDCFDAMEKCLRLMGLKNNWLSKEEEKALRDFDNIIWKDFYISELFEIKSPKKKFNANTLKFNGKFPYVARGESNNGIRGYIDQDEEYLNEGNTISFGQDTATMFYQEKPYFTGDKIKIFKAKESIEFNKLVAPMIISSMKKSFSTFSWGDSYNVNILKKVKIKLPITDVGTINYNLIVILTKAMQKFVSEEVVNLIIKRGEI